MVALPISTTSPTIAAIDAAIVGNAHRGFDLVIRGSSLGHKCERHLWYKFRWAHDPEEFDGKKLRIFDTGNVEEDRMVDWLRRAGVTVEAVDPETGQQWEVSALDGHLKGHADGKAQGIMEAPVTAHLLECKTHNDKSFRQLKSLGLRPAAPSEGAKPEHVAQMQIYMHLLGLTRAFYLAKNKNDDELYAERVPYNPAHAAALMAKAERILAAARPLDRISDDPEYFICKSYRCPSYGVCHGSDFALRNCRTCLHSTPAMGGDALWWCERDGRSLSLQDQEAGCGSHLFIPELVPGEQVDVGADGESVSYWLTDGSEWIDGRAA